MFSFLCYICSGTIYRNLTATSLDQCEYFMDIAESKDPTTINELLFPDTGTYIHFVQASETNCYRIPKAFIVILMNNYNNDAQVSIVGRDNSGNIFEADASDKPFGAACPNDEACEYAITATAKTTLYFQFGISTKQDIAYYDQSTGYYVIGKKEPFLILQDEYSGSLGTHVQLQDKSVNVNMNAMYSFLTNSLTVSTESSNSYAHIHYILDVYTHIYDKINSGSATMSQMGGSNSYVYPDELNSIIKDLNSPNNGVYETSGTIKRSGRFVPDRFSSYGEISNWPDMSFVVEGGKVFSHSSEFLSSLKTQPTSFVEEDSGSDIPDIPDIDQCSHYTTLELSSPSNIQQYLMPDFNFHRDQLEAGVTKCYKIPKGFIIGLMNNNDAQVSIVGRDNSGNIFKADYSDKPFGAACPNDETCEYAIKATKATFALIGYGITTQQDVNMKMNIRGTNYQINGKRESFLILQDDYTGSVGTYAKLQDNTLSVGLNQVYTVLTKLLTVSGSYSEYAQIHYYYDFKSKVKDKYNTGSVSVSDSTAAISYAYPAEYFSILQGRMPADGEFVTSGTIQKSGTYIQGIMQILGKISNWPEMSFVVEGGKVFSRSSEFLSSAKVQPSNPKSLIQNDNNNSDNDNKSGLGAGAIIGIVVAIIVVAAIAFGIVWFVVMKKRSGNISLEDETTKVTLV